MTAIFTTQYKAAYQVSASWQTLVDEVISGGEQRRNLWSNPKRSWALEFDKNNTDTNVVIDFFNARKGQFEAFYWTWLSTHPDTGKNLGGDDNTYLVRFSNDVIDLKHLFNGYTTFSLSITEVLS